MSFSFKAIIYKVGINPCIDVPDKISSTLPARRGYIPITGRINGFHFHQNLVPVKNGPYRLYVNRPMMKGGDVEVGMSAKFEIEADDAPPKKFIMPLMLRRRLNDLNLLKDFKKLTPSRQKEIIRYFASLKTDEARIRNLERIEKMFNENRKTLW